MKMLRYIAIAASFTLAAFSFASTASAAGNVTGFAWSDSAGWISMSCNNSALTDGNSMPNTCSTVDYGVTLDPVTGAMTGYAWSTNLGWLNFNSGGVVPSYSANRIGGARVTGVTTPGLRPTVGWARFCSNFNQSIMPDNCTGGNTITDWNGAWFGWVSMSGDGRDGNPEYGVKYDNVTGAFDGFAWGGTIEGHDGSEVAGWISFKGVYASKNPVAYVPIVKLVAIPPQVSQNGDTSIKYSWVNADSDPNHQIVSCSAFTDQGPQTNWNAGAITSANLPMAADQTKYNIWVPGSPTFYYLDCKDRAGNHAGDPLNSPMVGCDTSTPTTTANTCPRTRVDILNSSGILTMTIKDDTSSAPLSTADVTVNLGDTVSLSWKSASPISNCTGYSNLGVANWKLASDGGTPKAPISNTIESGVQVAPAATRYYMTCVINGRLEISNTVTAIVKNDSSSGLTLLGRANGSGTGWTGVVQVDPGQTVDLQWASTNTDTWSNCFAVPGTSPAASNWAANQIKLPITSANGYTTTELGIQVPVDPSIYRISCESASGRQESNDVIVNVSRVPVESINLEIKLDGDSDATYSQAVNVPNTPVVTNVTLRWSSSSQIQPGSCSGTSSPSATPEYWLRPNLSNPTGTESNINLLRTVGLQTTYTISCTTTSNVPVSASAYANPYDIATATPVLTLSGPNCVKNSGINAELVWKITNLNRGTITFWNDGGQSNWDGTQSPLQGVTEDEGSVFVNVTNPSVTNFELRYTHGTTGTNYVVRHPITLDLDCRESPRRSWFFQFFER